MTSSTATDNQIEDAEDQRHDFDTPICTLRAESCATLMDLDTAAKGRASIVRSCSESQGLSLLEREALKDLLRFITEQRKRLRATRRVWQSLDAFERPSAELVAATELCIRESQQVALALEPLRMHTVTRVSERVTATWAQLMMVAAQFTAEPQGSLRLLS